MEKAAQEQKQLLTEVIQKLMVILGADLTLSKVRNVHGMTVSDDGTVTDMQTEPAVLLQEVIGEFVGLSGEIVKQITDLLANKQMQQKPAVDLPAAPVQPGQDPALGMTMPTPTAIPVAPTPTATTAIDAAAAATVEPTPESTQEPAPTPPAAPTLQPQLSHNPFPNTQPAPTAPPIAEQPAQPQPEPAATAPVGAAETPAPTPAEPTVPVTAAPAQAPAAQPNQNDPDMQHIINEALKQTK